MTEDRFSLLGMIVLAGIAVVGFFYELWRRKLNRRSANVLFAQVVGAKGIAITPLISYRTGYVRVGSEIWPVTLGGSDTIEVGQWIRVNRVEDGKMIVTKVSD
ncbi:NfeD family protein [Sulfoacidibacillus thermotolerans]|nr:NfeD family protein [Sulfoacidibacillus thermotolerans]